MIEELEAKRIEDSKKNRASRSGSNDGDNSGAGASIKEVSRSLADSGKSSDDDTDAKQLGSRFGVNTEEDDVRKNQVKKKDPLNLIETAIHVHHQQDSSQSHKSVVVPRELELMESEDEDLEVHDDDKTSTDGEKRESHDEESQSYYQEEDSEELARRFLDTRKPAGEKGYRKKDAGKIKRQRGKRSLKPLPLQSDAQLHAEASNNTESQGPSQKMRKLINQQKAKVQRERRSKYLLKQSKTGQNSLSGQRQVNRGSNEDKDDNPDKYKHMDLLESQSNRRDNPYNSSEEKSENPDSIMRLIK